MKLQEKIMSLFMTAVLLSAGITSVSAQAGTNPQTEIILEPRRAAEGIDYDVYIENTRSLSTVIFTMEFTSKEKGTMSLADNACFDISHSEWSNEHNALLKVYLGRTGQEAGFSSDDKIKVAQISVPIDISKVGEIGVTVTKAVCAGIAQTDGNAVKGTIVVSEDAIKYTVRECSILSFDKNKVNILSSNNRTADVIYALYDTQGRFVKMYKENIELKQGENEISPTGIDFGQAETVSVMIWDGIDSMRPLADKTTINN